MPYPSTFSIIANDPEEKAWGIAVASKFLAVGNVVPWARAGAGAVATQSYANTSYGPKGLQLMAEGLPAEEALQRLIKDDPDSELRQVGLVDAQGRPATFTGSKCYDWAGGLTGEHFAAQGNILVGPQVVQAMAEAFTAVSGSLPHRLYRALLAGDQAGGDRRGRQSAAILVVKAEAGYGGFNDRWVDYRIDDDPDPVQKLGELLDLHDLYFGTSDPADRIHLRGEPLIRLQQILIRRGYYHGEPHGEYDELTKTALEAFIGSENFEERTDIEAGSIDRPVYTYLSRRFGDAS